MIEIKAARPVSFGNGTRKQGFVFATVDLKGDNGLFQLLQEVRKSSCKSVEKLETAKVALAESVTKREFTMVLNNAQCYDACDPTVAEKKPAKKPAKRKPAAKKADWKAVETQSLEISDDAKLVLIEAELSTLGKIEEHIKANKGLAVDGLTDEHKQELQAAMKSHIKGE